MNKIIENDHIKKIHNLLLKNPGLHLSKIAEILNMKVVDVEDHLQYLEKRGIINVTNEDGYKRYYIEKRKLKTRDKRSLETRKQILDLIAQNPGLYLVQISKMLGISRQLVVYHLSYLQKQKEIVTVKEADGQFKRFYIADSGIDKNERKVLEILREEIPLKIVLLLLEHNGLKHKQLWKKLGITPSGLSYHCNKLIDYGIVEVIPHGEDKGYVLSDKKGLIKILVRYEMKTVSERFTSVWKDLNIRSVKKVDAS